MSTHADEWKAANEKYGAASRKAKLRFVLAALAFAVVFGGTFLGVGSVLAGQEAAEDARLAEQGYKRVYYKRGRHVSDGERAANAGVLLFVIAGAAGVGAAAMVFFGMGGKLSAEYARGLDQLRR